jgi:fibronectin type 3 domain-containing protein
MKMKNTVRIIVFLLGITWNINVIAQYPAGFNAPKGIFILIDSTWHKSAAISIEKSENHGDFKFLINLTAPENFKDFTTGYGKATLDFPAYPLLDELQVRTFWNRLQSSSPMALFTMNPAGMVAACAAWYDKDVKIGSSYRYRIHFNSGSQNDLETGDIAYNVNISLPIPKFVSKLEEGKVINIKWGYTPRNAPSAIKLFRLTEGEKKFSEIPFNGGVFSSGDSILVASKDTSVKPMHQYKYCIQIMDWLGNLYPISDTIEAKAYSKLSAPVIRELQTRPVPEKHAIRLSWPEVKSLGTRAILIFRGTSKDGKYIHLATLPSRDTSFTDIVPLANENYWYFTVVANRFGYGNPGNRVFEVVKVTTIPFKPTLPYVTIKNNKPLISWKNTKGFHSGFVVYRGNGLRAPLHQLTNYLPAVDTSYLDTTAEPGMAYTYAVAVLGEGSGVSSPSDPVEIMVPVNGHLAVPVDLKGTLNGNQIRLYWNNLLVKDGRVKGYQVYRRIKGENGFSKLTSTPLNEFTNTYNDSITFSDKIVEYAVSSVDPQGIESRLSVPCQVETGTHYRKPVSGIYLFNSGGDVIITWPAISDRALKEYKIYRFTENSEPVEIGHTGVDINTFTDKSPIRGNKLNNYYIRAYYSDGTETDAEEIPAIRIP